jgi:pimeloyl-ACP methyl ester carboxylesterase
MTPAIQERRRARVSGIEIDVRTAGAGSPLLFLHPGSGLRDHDAFLNALAGQFSVWAPAHPGFDGSDLPSSFSTVDDLAYFYLDFLEEHDLTDVTLVGASFGAWIAAEVAIKCATRLSSLILIGPLGVKFAGCRERDISDLFAIPSYQQDLHLYRDEQLRSRSYADLEQADLMVMARNFESFALFGWSPTLFDPKLRQRLPRIKLPTLVLCGASDQVVSTDYSRAYADHIRSASFAIIADAGHYAHIEQPDAVSSRLGEFAAAQVRPSKRHAGLAR